MVAAEEATIRLQAMADDSAAARAARGRDSVNRALEAVEGVPVTVRKLELVRLVVLVAAMHAPSHANSLLGCHYHRRPRVAPPRQPVSTKRLCQGALHHRAPASRRR